MQQQIYHYSINNKLFLSSITVSENTTPVVANKSCNHIIVVDVSGSMSYELPELRNHLKSKLQTLIGDGDTVSIIWFSGRGQFGLLLDGVEVKNLADLSDVNAKIDRWLRPVGMTAFKEPLEEVGRVAQRLIAAQPDKACSMLFMTDGGDNCWSQAEILKAAEIVGQVVSSVAFVEYGYYSNRPLLTQMAERSGGSLVHAKDLQSFKVTFDATMQRRPVGSKKIEVDLPNVDAIGGIAFSAENGSVVSYAVEAGKVRVAEGTQKLFFLSPTRASVGAEITAEEGNYCEAITRLASEGKHLSPDLVTALYAAASLFVTRMKPDIVRPLLKATGDVAMIESFQNCFGKQAYSAFMERTQKAAFGEGRWLKGWDPSKVPADDAFTVVDLLRLLSSDNDNKLLLNHEKFIYARIGRDTVDANSVLTEEEEEKINDLQEQLSKVGKDLKKAKEINASIQSILDSKPAPLEFVEDPASAAAGYSVSNLVFNEERPNVSVNVKKTGTVDLSKRKDRPASVPDVFTTNIYRNYTIIKDGIVNVAFLPVKLSKETSAALKKQIADGKLAADALETTGDETIIDLNKIPVINANMVRETSANTLFHLEFKLTNARAAQAVYNAILKEKRPAKVEASFESLYGKEGAAWLKEAGFASYGFNPKRRQAESKDVYIAKEMKVSLSGLSSLPKLSDVRSKMKEADKKPLTASVSLMANYVDPADEMTVEELESAAEAQTSYVRALLQQKSQMLFSVVVGNAWFKEFASLDENSMNLTFLGREYTCSVNMSETEVKV